MLKSFGLINDPKTAETIGAVGDVFNDVMEGIALLDEEEKGKSKDAEIKSRVFLYEIIMRESGTTVNHIDLSLNDEK